ncbi:MAG: hypothetical protein B6D64_08475, partial [Bacteroidetes bacterium 4484_276]
NGTGYYNTSYTYGLNGNIDSLSRKGKLCGSSSYDFIDNLTYQYNGNQLTGVNDVDDTDHQDNGYSDNGSFENIEYFYDANGNMTQDLNKQINNIEYNYLNLPQRLEIGQSAGNILHYIYDASGRKLRKQKRVDQCINTNTDYCGSFVYEEGELQYILTEEGRIVPDGGGFRHQYFLKDHLGNTRVMFNEEGTILQDDSYYPFGMAMEGLSFEDFTYSQPNKYLYNGKELQDEFGLGWYDYGARFYDAQLGRFHTQDRFSEKYYSLTNYGYAANNPVLLIDVNGDSVVYKNESTQQYVEQFTSKTRVNKRGKEVKNKKYSAEFAQIISGLDASSTVYEFDDSYSSSDPAEGGAVSTDGEKVSVGFNEPNEGYGSKSNALFEETYHAHQVETGTMEIVESKNSSTGYGFRGDGLEAEYQAKRFAAIAPGTSLNYTNSQGLKIETQMGLIKRLSPLGGKRYLTKGYTKLYPGLGSSSYEVKYDPPYPEYNK